MKYKVGDKVRIKSLEWYKSAYKDNDGDIKCDGHSYFFNTMQEFCGEVMTIEHAYGLHYSMVEDVYGWHWDDEMIECLVEPTSKMVSLDRIVEYLDSELYTTCDYFGNIQTACRDSINKNEFIEKLCKAMGE